MNTTKLLVTLIFIGLLATSSYFLFSSSESTPEVIANEGPSQDFIEVMRTPSVPCRPLTFTDKHLSVDIQGIDNCSLPVSSTFDVNWKIEQKVPLQNKQYDFIAFSMSHTVRFNGTGFLMLPPEVKLPFNFQFADDQMRVLFPLYLPQSQTTQGTFQIRPLVAGKLTLNWAYLVVNEQGEIVFSSKNNDTSMTFEIQERKNPKLVVQDRVGIEKPEKVLLSPSREYEVRVFEDRFQVLYANTGELLFERAGVEPNFSPGSQFLGYFPATGKSMFSASIEIVDLLTQNSIASYPSFQVVAWGKNDSFLAIGFHTWRERKILLPFLEKNNIIDIGGSGHYFAAWEYGQISMDLENALIHFENDSGEGGVLYDLISCCDEKGYFTSYSIENKKNYVQSLQSFGFPMAKNYPTGWELEDLKITHLFKKASQFEEELKNRYKTDLESCRYSSQGSITKRKACEKDMKAGLDRSNEMLNFLIHPVSLEELSSLKIASLEKSGNSIRGNALTRGVETHLVGDMSKISRNILRRLGESGLHIQINNMLLEEQNEWAWKGEEQIIKYLKDHPKFQNDPNIYKLLSISNQFDVSQECIENQEYIVHEEAFGIKYQYWNNKGNELLLVQTQCNSGAASNTVYLGNLILFASFAEQKKYKISLEDAVVTFVGKPNDNFWGYLKLGTWNSYDNEIKSFLAGNILLVASIDGPSITVFDVEKNQVKAFIDKDIPEPQDIDSIHLSQDGKLVLQINEGGRFYLYNIASQQRILNGLYIDDEIVLYTDDGFYDGTREGAYYITWHYPGIKQHFAFNQFESKFKRPDLIKAILNGQTVNKPKVQLLPPPSVEMVVDLPDNYAPLAVIGLKATSIRLLSNLRVFVDGTPVAEMPLRGRRQARTTVILKLKRGKHWITAIAHNDQGYSSIPQSVMVDASKVKAKGSNLYVLGVGIDRYPNLPQRKNLDYAKQDIITFTDTVKANPAQQYETIVVKQLLDQQATASNIQQSLHDIIQQATADDTIMLYFAGHGDKGRNDKFYFLTPQASFTDFETTALAWDKVATLLAQAKAKVVVFLDACHSGVASQETIVPNDEYVTELMKAGKAGMAIIAASKGRQSSLEAPQLGHGVFSYMLTQALTENRSTTDVNKNGIIELEELYRSIKYNVRKYTDGEQTPWISRNEIIGEMPLL